jgi:hypothetical protein
MDGTSSPRMIEPAARQADGPARFCRLWLLCVLVLVALVGTFNAVVDPYLVIGAPRIAGFNAAKPETETHTLLAKTYLMRRAVYPGMMFGDSKVDIGLDPQSAAWPDDSRPVFNDGLPGSGIDGTLEQLRRVAATGTLRRALVFVELGEFMQPAGTVPQPGANAVSGTGQRLHDLALSTLSLDALWSSLATIAAQHTAYVVDLSPDGATGDGGFRAIIAVAGAARRGLQPFGHSVGHRRLLPRTSYRARPCDRAVLRRLPR